MFNPCSIDEPVAEGPRSDPPRLSIVMCTYNRGVLLEDAVRSVLAQEPTAPRFELIIVDNNSTDRTRAIVERLTRADDRVRYVFERQQGLSFARNAGILGAGADVVAFTDDDVRVASDWVSAILRAFDEYPQAHIVGGRVLPRWPLPPPDWLTAERWAPLALVDHGDRPVAITSAHPICPIGANMACRRVTFERVGTFAAGFQRVRDGIGSLEDHEFLLRLLRAGLNGLYDPRIVVHAEVQADRMERAYHRRWHTGHGHYHALLRSEQLERTNLGSVLGVPAHLYRQALQDVIGWVCSRTRPAQALHHELRLRFFMGFVRTRSREFLEKAGQNMLRVLSRLLPARRVTFHARPLDTGSKGP